MKYRISLGHSNIDKQAKANVNQVLNTGWLSSKVFIPRFESEIARLHGAKFGVMINSGTDALRIALATLKEARGWKNGSEVIVPAVTFVATVNVVLNVELRPVLVDVDPYTYNLDPRKLGPIISKNTVAIMPVHLFGLPADMDSILILAKRHRLKVIEDSCECMFVSKVVGDIACYSTYMSHIVTTGVGGILATSNAKYEALARSYMNHGRDLKHPESFKFDRIGYSSRATEMEAALGCAQVKRWKEILGKRQEIGKKLKYGLAALGRCDLWQLPQISHSLGRYENAFMMFPILLKTDVRAKVMTYLRRKGIECREMMPLVTQKPYLKWYKKGSCPVAENIARRGFYIPCHDAMTDKDVDYIVKTLGDL